MIEARDNWLSIMNHELAKIHLTQSGVPSDVVERMGAWVQLYQNMYKPHG